MTAFDGQSLSPWAQPPRVGEGRLRRAAMCLGSLLRALVLSFGLGAAAPALAAGHSLPSGQTVELLDAHIEVQGNGARWLVLRYLAPRIAREGGDLGYDALADDFDRLCDRDGLFGAAEAGDIDQIVIVLLDRAVPRGAADPDATQLISAYLATEAGCVWQ